MSDYTIMKALEYDKLPAKFRKERTFQDLEGSHWAQRKYDGCFGVAIIRLCEGEYEMQSRTGEHVYSCYHILEALSDNLRAYGHYGDYVILGEVWHTMEKFPYISGKFRQHKAAPDLVFVPFDFLTLEEFQTGLSVREYQHRFQDASKLASYTGCIRECVSYPDASGVQRLAAELQRMGGYDGAIMRDPSAGYTRGTAKRGEVIKVKPTKTLDLRVMRVEPGLGKHLGTAGSVVVSYKGVETAVGTGLSESDRDFWWAERNEPDVALAGFIIEVEYLDITADGKLREPRYRGVRDDKVKADDE